MTIPKLFENMESQILSISYAGCLTQMYFFLFFADQESFLLLVITYDCCVAICFPLHYTSIMNPELCLCLVVLSWVLTLFHVLLYTLLMAKLTLWEQNDSPLFHDLSALLKLANSVTKVNELVGGLVGVIPFILIIMCYAHIVSSFLKDFSSQDVHKVFSTCGSHLSLVSLFYGTCSAIYLSPSCNNSAVKENVLAFICIVVTPMANTYIYSLKNRDMHGVLRTVLRKDKIPIFL
jgi:olfactory receptor